jgi:hypothetical protein
MKTVYASTHADFLNQTFGTSYQAWMKSRWSYDKDTWVWMVAIDEKVRSGWKNKIIDKNEIHEYYVGNDEPTYVNEIEKPYRIIVRILEKPSTRIYSILGKYKYVTERSNERKHVFVKIEDIY